MKTLFIFPFLALFGAPLAWETNVWHSHPFVSAAKTETAAAGGSLRHSPATLRDHTRDSATPGSQTASSAASPAASSSPHISWKTASPTEHMDDGKPPSEYPRTRLPNTRERTRLTPYAHAGAARHEPLSTRTLSALEEQLSHMISDARTRNGLNPLMPDASLGVIARAHSADMSLNQYFDHEDRSGCGVSCRATGADSAWGAVAENIFMTKGGTPEAAAAQAQSAWLASDRHRTNMLNQGYTRVGIGAWGDENAVYITAVFAN